MVKLAKPTMMPCCSLNHPVHEVIKAKTKVHVRRLTHQQIERRFFFLHVGLKDLNTFPLSEEQAAIPSSKRHNTTSFDYHVQMTHYSCLLLLFKPKYSQTDGCALRLAGCIVFFHSVVNVFVNAVPLMDDGYDRVQ